MSTTVPTPQPCPHCPSKFLHAHNLRQHIRTHEGWTPSVCETCGQAYTKMGDLKRHRKRVHAGIVEGEKAAVGGDDGTHGGGSGVVDSADGGFGDGSGELGLRSPPTLSRLDGDAQSDVKATDETPEANDRPSDYLSISTDAEMARNPDGQA